MNQVALAYVLSREEISLCIPGAKSAKQLESNVKASEFVLSSKQIEEIDKIQQSW